LDFERDDAQTNCSPILLRIKISRLPLHLRLRTWKMGREEQQEEREVLDSIFPDEITGIIDL
jgi:hypothetical protein